MDDFIISSLEKLTLVHHYQNNYLPFLDNNLLNQNVNKHIDTELLISNNSYNKKNLDTSVTELTKHLPSRVMEQFLKYFTRKKVNKKEEFINIPRKTRQGNLVEGVSEITGIAIPSYFELINKGVMSIYNELNSKISVKTLVNDYSFISDSDEESDDDENIKTLSDIDLKNINTSDLLFIANRWNAYKSGYNFKINQINNYNWLSKENLIKCISRLSSHITKNSKFEVKSELEELPELLNRKLKGFFDCLDNNNLWEIKCVKSLRDEHYLQLAIYMYMHKKTQQIKKECNKLDIMEGDIIRFRLNNLTPYQILGTVKNLCYNGKIQVNFKNKCYTIGDDLIAANITLNNNKNRKKSLIEEDFNYYLFNVLSNEIVKIDSNLENLEEMISFLIKHKYFNVKEISDKQFIEKVLKLYSKYYIN